MDARLPAIAGSNGVAFRLLRKTGWLAAKGSILPRDGSGGRDDRVDWVSRSRSARGGAHRVHQGPETGLLVGTWAARGNVPIPSNSPRMVCLRSIIRSALRGFPS